MRTMSLGDCCTSAGFFSANPGAPNGIEPGAPCYDASHDPGYVHGVSAIEYALQTVAGYDVTTNLSDAEIACLAGSVAGTTAGGAPAPGVSQCPWYCSLPGASSLFTSGCNPATCAPTSTSSNVTSFALVAGAAVVGIMLLLEVAKK